MLKFFHSLRSFRHRAPEKSTLPEFSLDIRRNNPLLHSSHPSLTQWGYAPRSLSPPVSFFLFPHTVAAIKSASRVIQAKTPHPCWINAHKKYEIASRTNESWPERERERAVSSRGIRLKDSLSLSLSATSHSFRGPKFPAPRVLRFPADFNIFSMLAASRITDALFFVSNLFQNLAKNWESSSFSQIRASM